MWELRGASPVKLFAGVILTPESGLDREVLRAMAALWGEVDTRFAPVPFDLTDYYESEMGAGLIRLFAGFEPLRAPERLPAFKVQANRLELELATTGAARRVNVDVGYLDLHKVVLASAKEGPAKIYLGGGIWADMTLRFENGRFSALPWTFPDFADGRYDGFFDELRRRYKAALRTGGSPPN